MTQHQNLMDCGKRFFQYGSYLCTLSLQPVCTFCLQNLHFHPCFVWPAQWKGSSIKYDGFHRQKNVWQTSEHLAAEITRCYFLVSVFNEQVSIAFVAHSIGILRLKKELKIFTNEWILETCAHTCLFFKCFIAIIHLFLVLWLFFPSPEVFLDLDKNISFWKRLIINKEKITRELILHIYSDCDIL